VTYRASGKMECEGNANGARNESRKGKKICHEKHRLTCAHNRTRPTHGHTVARQRQGSGWHGNHDRMG
jgi:hypothetical protein